MTSALARSLVYARFFAGHMLAVAGVVAILNAILPDNFKPSTLIGGFVGLVDRADILAKQEAAVEFERRKAAATAIPPALAQMETNSFQTQQQVLSQSMDVKSGLAQAADLACVAGSLAPLLRDLMPGTDLESIGKQLSASCAMADGIRRDMVDDLREAGQGGSTVIPRTAP